MSENSSQKVFIPNLFERAKEVTFDVVLGELGLLDHLQVVGDEIRGKCPLCGGERCFSANPIKGVWLFRSLSSACVHAAISSPPVKVL